MREEAALAVIEAWRRHAGADGMGPYRVVVCVGEESTQDSVPF